MANRYYYGARGEYQGRSSDTSQEVALAGLALLVVIAIFAFWVALAAAAIFAAYWLIVIGKALIESGIDRNYEKWEVRQAKYLNENFVGELRRRLIRGDGDGAVELVQEIAPFSLNRGEYSFSPEHRPNKIITLPSANGNRIRDLVWTDTLTTLQRASQSSDPNERFAVLEAVAAMPFEAFQYLATMLPFLESVLWDGTQDSLIRGDVARLLGAIAGGNLLRLNEGARYPTLCCGCPDTLKILAAHISDPERDVRYGAIEGLALCSMRAGDHEATDIARESHRLLDRALSSRDKDTRRFAIIAIGDAGLKSYLIRLKRIADSDREPSPMREAAQTAIRSITALPPMPRESSLAA